MIKGIDRVLLRVSALPAAVKFYQSVMGLQLVNSDDQTALLKTPDGQTQFVLHSRKDLPDAATYFRVDSIRQLYDQRTELGLKFAGQPKKTANGFTATFKDPFGNVLQVVDYSSAAQPQAPASSDLPPAPGLFSAVIGPALPMRVPIKRPQLISLYQQLGRTADDLPYTSHFETLCRSYADLFDAADAPEPREVWRHLLTLRKAGKLPKLGAAKSLPPQVTDEEKQLIIELMQPHKGKRDRLPYTPAFDDILTAYNANKKKPHPPHTPLTPHLLWRLIATLSK